MLKRIRNSKNNNHHGTLKNDNTFNRFRHVGSVESGMVLTAKTSCHGLIYELHRQHCSDVTSTGISVRGIIQFTT